MNQDFLKKIAALGIPKGVDPAEFARLRMLYRPLRTRLSLVTVSGVLGLFSGIILLIFFAPLRAWEVVPAVIMACAVPGLLLTRVLIATITMKLPTSVVEVHSETIIQRNTGLIYELTGLGKNWQRITDKNLRQSGPVVVLYCFFGLTLFLTGAALSLNQLLDRSEGVAFEATVQEKIFTHGKHKSKNYFLRIVSPVPAWLPWLNFGDGEDIRVTHSIYDRTVEGATTITLIVHDGALGLPWHQLPQDAFGNLSSGTSSASSLGDNLVKEIQAACHWRDAFNMAEEIGQEPTQNYRREFWPNGALKAEEPLINGVIHGVGQYWFATGSRYANIPYRKGQKHGTFILHRPDGAIEQQLSYKDGQLYGINTWYGENGTVTTSVVYLADNLHFPLSYCNSKK